MAEFKSRVRQKQNIESNQGLLSKIVLKFKKIVKMKRMPQPILKIA